MMRETWTLAVLGDMNSSAAICSLVRPVGEEDEDLALARGQPVCAVVARTDAVEAEPVPSRPRHGSGRRVR